MKPGQKLGLTPFPMTTTLDFDWSDGPSAAVVTAVASELGTDLDELDAPLNDYVDPDALDALFAPTYDGVPRPEGRVTFAVHGCEVTVDGRGEVTAEQLAGSVGSQEQADESRTPG